MKAMHLFCRLSLLARRNLKLRYMNFWPPCRCSKVRRSAIEFEGGLGFFLTWKRAKRTGERLARFRQVHLDKPHVHHDALEFPNGEFVLLTRLCEGQFATVLQLPAAARNMENSEQEKNVAGVG
jgi:hypothetical protein